MIKNIIRGIKAYGGTLKLISKLGLWQYFVVPVVISIVTFGLIGLAAWGLSGSIGGLISNVWFWEWGSETFRKISELLGALAVLALGLITYKHIILALCAPFMSPVSSTIEVHLLGKTQQHRATTNAAQLLRGVRINIRNFLLELLFTIPLLMLSLIPGVNFITGILLFLIQAYYAGFGNMDYTLERHFKYDESIQFVRNNSGVAIGNGIVFMAMLFIPILGIILVLPLSVTASTTETIRLLKESGKLKVDMSQNIPIDA